MNKIKLNIGSTVHVFPPKTIVQEGVIIGFIMNNDEIKCEVLITRGELSGTTLIVPRNDIFKVLID